MRGENQGSENGGIIMREVSSLAPPVFQYKTLFQIINLILAQVEWLHEAEKIHPDGLKKKVRIFLNVDNFLLRRTFCF